MKYHVSKIVLHKDFMRMYLQTYTVYSSRPDKGNKIDTDKLHFWKSTVLNNSNTNASLRQAVIFFFFFSHITQMDISVFSLQSVAMDLLLVPGYILYVEPKKDTV